MTTARPAFPVPQPEPTTTIVRHDRHQREVTVVARIPSEDLTVGDLRHLIAAIDADTDPDERGSVDQAWIKVTSEDVTTVVTVHLGHHSGSEEREIHP